MKASLIIGCLVIVGLAFARPGYGEPKIQVLAHPFPPFSIQLPKGQATGMGVEIFRIIAEDMGMSKDDYVVKPVTFRRMYVEVQKAPRRVGIAVSRIPQREELFRWAGPYAQITSGLIAKKKRQIRILSIDDISKYKVASVFNSAPEQALVNMGIPKQQLESAFRPQSNIYKLAHDRVDLMAHPVQSASFMMWQFNIEPSAYELVYKIHEPGLHFVFSNDFSVEEIRRYDEALAAFRKTKAYEELVKIYRLEDINIPVR